MPKYRAKPVVIEAEPFRPGLEDGWKHPTRSMFSPDQKQGYVPFIDTLEGQMIISPTDYIITGTQGERYPCKKEIFEHKYEPAPDEDRLDMEHA